MIITKSTPYTKEEIKIEIESLSMDLVRVSLFYRRGSIKSAEVFTKEALKCIERIQTTKVKPNFAKILDKAQIVLNEKNQTKIAEDALMYSTLCRNYAKKFL